MTPFKEHQVLDAAVAASYGWEANITDDEAFVHLFQLSNQRAKGAASSLAVVANEEGDEE